MYGKNTEALLYNKDSAEGTNLSAQLSAVEMGGKTRARRPFFPGNFLSQSRADVILLPPPSCCITKVEGSFTSRFTFADF